MQLAPYFSSFVNEYGVNDLNGGVTASALEALNVSMASTLSAYGPTISCTIPPSNASSTDNFATTVNQTPAADNAQKQLYNTYVRGLTPHYFEIAYALEDPSGSGIWYPGSTSTNTPWNGVHPDGYGYGLIVTYGGVNPAWIT